MPYTKFRKAGRYCIRNKKTKKVTCFDSEETADKMIRLREAFAHGWVMPHNKRSKRGRRFNVRKHYRRK